MAKFHITEGGNPGPCSATVRACPLGGEDKHFGSEDEARAAFAAEQGGSFAALLCREAPVEKAFEPSVLDYHPQENYPGMLDEEDMELQRKDLAKSPAVTAMVPRPWLYNSVAIRLEMGERSSSLLARTPQLLGLTYATSKFVLVALWALRRSALSQREPSSRSATLRPAVKSYSLLLWRSSTTQTLACL